jgi:hypothetical protein
MRGLFPTLRRKGRGVEAARAPRRRLMPAMAGHFKPFRQGMIRKSGNRFSEKIMLEQKLARDPEKWEPVFRKDQAQTKVRAKVRFDSKSFRSKSAPREPAGGIAVRC